jgi:shikimate dehydrogenase
LAGAAGHSQNPVFLASVNMSDPFDFDKPPALYAVMGNPIGHSKSPAIHDQFARQCGIRLEYRAIQVDPGGFDQAVGNFRAAGGAGLNVTVPFKVDAWRLANRRSERAELAGAVNTLKFEEGDSLFGDNTDGAGLVRDLSRNLGYPLEGKRLLVLGAGGAVRGILLPLLEAGVAEVVIANRTASRARQLAEEFSPRGSVSGCGFDELDGLVFDIVINGTSASLSSEVPPLPDTVLVTGGLAYDLMYADEPTAFMRWGQVHGAGQIADGLGMLVEQAAESFYIWHGVRPDTAPVIRKLRQGG